MNSLEETKEILSDIGIDAANYEVDSRMTTISVKALLTEEILHEITEKSLQSDFNRMSAKIMNYDILHENEIYAVFDVVTYDGLEY